MQSAHVNSSSNQSGKQSMNFHKQNSKPLYTEPSCSKSPASQQSARLNSTELRHFQSNEQPFITKNYYLAQKDKSSPFNNDNHTLTPKNLIRNLGDNDIINFTPSNSVIDEGNQSLSILEGSVLAQKIPVNKIVKASGAGHIKMNKSPNPVSRQQQIQMDDQDDLNWKSIWSSKLKINVEMLQMSKSNNKNKVIELMKAGADINARDIDGNAPLHFAAMNGNSELVSLFLYNEAIIDILNKKQQTPLHLSCIGGFEEILQQLMTAGADINSVDSDLNSGLHLAVMNCNNIIIQYQIKEQKKIIEILLRRPSLDVLAKNSQGKKAADLIKDQDIQKMFSDAFTTLQQQGQIPIYDLLQNTNAANSFADEKIGTQNFTVHGMIGKGSFGEVFFVQRKDTDEVYAMKVLHKSKIMKQNLTRYALTERNVLSVTRHPFIVRLKYAFQTIDKLFLILDYCPGGDLGEHLKKEKKFPEERVKLYLTQLVLALEDLHKRDIIFRDLKPDNIVLDAQGYAMLTDFGLSKEGVFEHNTGARSFCGSVAYLAPEMLKRCGHGKAVDWYLLGVVMYEMLVGMPPYYANDREELFNNIQKAALKIPSYISLEGKNLLKALLQRNPAKRLGSSKRDAEEIKAHEYFKDIKWDDVYNRKLKLQIPQRKIKLYRRADQDVFEQQSFVEQDKQHIPGWSFIEK